MKQKTAWLAVGLLMLSPVVCADSTQKIVQSLVKDVKPGLWEVTNKTAVDGQQLPDMNKMLEKVPPEMRAQVEAMLEKKSARLASGKAVQVCLTKEQLAKQEYENNPQDRCQLSNIQRNGDTTHVTVQCSKPKAQGETTVTRINSKAWTSVSQMSVEEGGSTHAVSSEASAKWLSDTCAAAKPEPKAEAMSPEQKAALKAQLKAAAAQALEKN